MESQTVKQQMLQLTLDPTVERDPFESLDHILDVAEEEGLLPMVVNENASAIKDPGVNLTRYYLLGFAHFRSGAPEAAWPAVVPLAGKLEQEGHWRALALLCGKALEYAPRVEAALHIAKAFESAGIEKLDPALLQKAYDGFPDESRLSSLMGDLKALEAERLEGGAQSEAGQRLMEEARSFWAEALDGFVTLKRHTLVEDAILKIADSSDPEILRHVLAALRKMGEQGQWGRMDGAQELALKSLREAGLIQELWNITLKLLPSAPATATALRRNLRDLAAEAFPQVDGIMDLLNRSGILDPETKVETAMKTLDPLLTFAPGYYILHASWGVGKIRLNDGETLILDFQDASNHRMAITLARRALTVVPADDIRVLKVQDPAGLRARLKSDPVGIVFLVIRQLGGEATTQEMKRTLLAAEVLTASQWASWWKDAKVKCEQDDRIDLSQAFRQTYRIKSASDESALALPTLEPRRGIRPNLNLIRRFLDQHPDETARAARTYTSILKRWAAQERTNAEERLAVALQIFRWQKKVDNDFLAALKGMLEAKIEASVYSDHADQELITEVGLSHKDLWRETACFALSSRYSEIRDLALEKLRQDPKTSRSILSALILDPSERPVAALTAMGLATARGGVLEPFAPGVWEAAIGATALAEAAIREPLRKQALSLLSPNTSLVEMLLKTSPADSQLDQIGMLVRRWRSSERFLQPLLTVLRRTGHEEMIRELRTQRMAKTNQMLQSQMEQDQFDYHGHFMTRITFERLKREIEKLNWELKTTVAQAIAKARALGDLSENAEFDAARMKQRDFAERIASTASRLREAKIIDELSLPPGRVAPGTEVLVEDIGNGRTRTFWILGEGDDVLGEEVISCTAPLGLALLGRQVGDQIRLPGEGMVHEYAVRSIVPRMPAAVPTEEMAEGALLNLPGGALPEGPLDLPPLT